MADLEQQSNTAQPQQDDSAVAMTEVAAPEQPAEQAMKSQAQPERDHEAVDAEHGSLQEAATVNDSAAELQMEDVSQFDEQQTIEPALTELASTVNETADEVSQLVHSVHEDKENPIEKAEAEEQIADVTATAEVPTENTTAVVEGETEETKNEKTGDSSADDLFGSEDEGAKPTGNDAANADDDSEIEAVTPTRPTASGEDSARGTTRDGEDDDEDEDEDQPMRKKQRGESPTASEGHGNDNYSRDVDGERNDRDRRQDEEDERTAEFDENDEALARKRALDARIEAIGKGGKRKRSRKKDDSEDLGLDRQIEEMTTMMDNAIRSDIEMNKIRKPALRKTQILNKVIAVLQNASLQQSILESNDFLSTLRRFIEPMEDGSLPSLTIQKGILFQLGRLEGLEVIHLRNSGLGKVVNFYTRCKRSQPEIVRQANLLIDRWSKPILDTGNNARASARARAEAEREDEDGRRGEGGERGEGASDGDNSRPKERKHHRTGELLRQRVLNRESDAGSSQKGTRLPNIIGHAYAVAPQARRSAKGPEEQAMEEARQRESERINRFKKKVLQAHR